MSSFNCPCSPDNVSYDVEAAIPVHRVSAFRVPVPDWNEDALSSVSDESDDDGLPRFLRTEPSTPYSPIALPNPPPLPRVSTFCPAIALDQAYEEAIGQVNTITPNNLKEAWLIRKHQLLIKKYETDVKALVVEILGNGGKEEVLSQLLAKIQVVDERDELSTAFYTYKVVVPVLTNEGEFAFVPQNVMKMTLLNDPFFINRSRVSIHDLMNKTGVLDILERAFGEEHFSIFRTFDKIAEEENYSLYDWTLHLKFHPNGRDTE
jgi:hypothetical protein